ncbi:MAG: HK97 family phage prohead protease [Anaerolineales bacterium]
MSDATPDRYGDVISADGWDLRNFSKNPICLWNHHSDIPIGTWENIRVQDGALRGHLKMAPAGTSPKIDELRALIEANILRAVSVGFVPLESKPRPNSNRGELYLKQELIECSLTSTPANPSALAIARSLGISKATEQLVFTRQTDLTIGQRIRKARQAVRKAKLLQERANTPAARACMARAIAMFEKEERELRTKLRAVPKQTAAERQAARAREVRAKALALIKRIDAQIAEEADPFDWDSVRRATAVGGSPV